MCNLDPVNMYCWEHGVSVDSSDLSEGCCAMDWCEACGEPGCNGECEEYDPDEDYHDAGF